MMKIISSENLFERLSAYKRVKEAAIYQINSEIIVNRMVYRSVDMML